MSHKYTENTLSEGNEKPSKKREYVSPQLVHYGSVRDLTKNSGGATTEAGGSCIGKPPAVTKVCSSERRVKENIVRVGTHPLGIGLYLFDYLPEYRDNWGHGRQFGVMIDEVETVMPEAVSRHADGYKRVDYDLLGISRTLH